MGDLLVNSDADLALPPVEGLPAGLGCPSCGEHDVDKLLLRSDVLVECLVCHTVYRLVGEVPRG